MDYKVSKKEEKINVINLNDLEARAKAFIPKGGYEYISGGAEDEWTLKENTLAFNKKQITPRVCSGDGKVNIETQFLGVDLKTPIMVSPAAAHNLSNIRGELATAEASTNVGTIFAYSTYAGYTIEDIAKAGKGSPQFFQLYISKNENMNKYLLDEAMKNGVKAIIVTLDATVGGYREADILNDFVFPYPSANLVKFSDNSNVSSTDLYGSFTSEISLQLIESIKNYINIPIIAKGIQSPLDAERLISIGVDAIQVSNHGGRQLDGGPASFDVLEDIAKVVNKRVPIIFDSGIRRGEHIFKAIASGADIVAFARPVFYALSLGGAQGVECLFEHINQELKITMQLAGCKTIEDIKKTQLLSIPYNK